MFNNKKLLFSIIIFIFVISVTSRPAMSREILYGKVNINTADRHELVTLGGVDLAKADAVIKYRETVRNFKTVEEFLNVPGISKDIFNINKDFIYVKPGKK
ncbi:competence protein [Candidatus Scalindua japonica]|uniref:Competence protein n=1 Tax=Candidatus Scalindua japonica TaxID=1284222 RepID=A0A286U0Z9_9BACT|nr:helix-hairpin-helix domain-containing protein [Candidatus Scalindua japonica]GAX61823.1 competence protein [Candidatus Scalindua japonica]